MEEGEGEELGGGEGGGGADGGICWRDWGIAGG